MKLLLAILISVFSMSSFSQSGIDLSGSKVNLKICKSVELEIASLSKKIASLKHELKELQSAPKPDKKRIKQVQDQIESSQKRLAALSAFFEKFCKKDVVDCDQLKLKLASLEKEIIAKKDQLTRLLQELRAAEKAGDKARIIAIKKRIALLEAELTKLSEALGKLREIYKKNCL